LGGEIYIHCEEARAPTSAYGKVSRGTRGCIALENSAIQELFERTAIGTPVIITP
jgi:lipoprotein-anchoring transpeptidase ErfK/SrfK